VKILVLNVGSSSIKFQLIDTDDAAIAAAGDTRLARGQVERIGGEAIVTLEATGAQPAKSAVSLRDHASAVEYLIGWLVSTESGVPISRVGDIDAVGHRVVHGGERFHHSTLVTDDVRRGLEDLIELAPLHNPHNLRGIAAARAVLGPDVPQVAVFDTAFHHSLPETAYLYAIPYQLYRRYGVRRYGFHGTSHRYVAYRYRQLTGRSREHTNVITLHLGNGASACAISGGRSVDTSMGFTPLEGLVMATRCGDVDPGLLLWIQEHEGLTERALADALERRSGLLGLTGSADMRQVLSRTDPEARLGLAVYLHRLRAGIAAMAASLGGLDALVFTGGVGENAAPWRSRAAEGLRFLGISVDRARNDTVTEDDEISGDDARVRTFVIRAREDLEMARQARGCLRGG
jgi:acetate kinase